MDFGHRLDARFKETGSLLCVGLDPHLEQLSEPSAEAAFDACMRVVDATRDLALAFKPNAAFFERFGASGWVALKRLVAAIEPFAPVILDAKRGDISSTAEAYADAAFLELGASAITLHPLLGQDSVEPFLREPHRGVFLLCRTSNPGAAALQELTLAATGAPLYEHIAHLASQWGRSSQVGLVVGATASEALPRVRRANPGAWILSPGVGAQGGDLEQTLRLGRRGDGGGVLISVSRAIARAENPRQAARALVERMQRVDSGPSHDAAALEDSVASQLIATGCVRFGQFKLKSGLMSPIYLDLRRLCGHPKLLAAVAARYAEVVVQLAPDRLAALPYAGLPIGTAVSLASGVPLCFPRKTVKAYGTGASIEGPHQRGERALMIDDLATRGTSAIEAVPQLREAGLVVEDLLVLVDRCSGAGARLAEHGVRLHALYSLRDLLAQWRSDGALTASQQADVEAFLAADGAGG